MGLYHNNDIDLIPFATRQLLEQPITDFKDSSELQLYRTRKEGPEGPECGHTAYNYYRGRDVNSGKLCHGEERNQKPN